MSHIDKRIEKLRLVMKQKNCAILVSDNVTRRYLFGFPSSAGYGYISENTCNLYLDFRYFEKAVLMQKEGKVSKLVTICKAEKPKAKTLKELALADGVSEIMFEEKRTVFSEYKLLSDELFPEILLVEAGDTVERMRAQKDEYEISKICQAQEITDRAFSYICGYIKKGMTERQVATELEFYMRKNGAHDIAFSTICVSGKKSSMPHGEPDETVIENGFLTLDFGAKVDGYCSDMTRTVCVGKPDEQMRSIYNTVLEAQNAAFSKIVPGVVGKDVDAAARKVISDAGYGECFGHSTGHSLGLEVHESPNFSGRELEKIPEGAVLSVEPGIYIDGKCGVRIEDIVFLTENGYINLTNSTKEFIII